MPPLTEGHDQDIVPVVELEVSVVTWGVGVETGAESGAAVVVVTGLETWVAVT